MCLRFVFLLITRTVSWLRLSRRGETWRIAEILILRHQLAVLQRRQPCRPGLNWADRALLASLLGVIPKARRQGLRLLVTPDTMLRWHRDIVRRRWAARSMRGKTGRPATRRNIRALVLRLALAVVLAWQVTRCAICLRCAGIGCRRKVPGPCRYGLIAAAGGWFVRLASARVRPGWMRLGAQSSACWVCAGQAVLRTVSVAVRAMGRLNARGHGHIDDMHRARLS